MVRLPLGEKCELNDEGEWGQTPLMAATMKNKVDVARALLEGGADPNVFDLLRTAITRKHEQILNVLSKGGLEANNLRDYGFSSLKPRLARVISVWSRCYWVVEQTSMLQVSAVRLHSLQPLRGKARQSLMPYGRPELSLLQAP